MVFDAEILSVDKCNIDRLYYISVVIGDLERMLTCFERIFFKRTAGRQKKAGFIKLYLAICGDIW